MRCRQPRPNNSYYHRVGCDLAQGLLVTLQRNTSGESYLFIDKLSGVRGTSYTVRPQATTTYKLSATNQYGRATKSVTATVK